MLQTAVGRNSIEGLWVDSIILEHRKHLWVQLECKAFSSRTLTNGRRHAGNLSGLEGLASAMITVPLHRGSVERSKVQCPSERDTSVSPGPLVHTSPIYHTKVAPAWHIPGHFWSALTTVPAFLPRWHRHTAPEILQATPLWLQMSC